MSATLRLAEQLISLPSVTPFDAGCIELIVARLQPLGFACEVIESGPPGLSRPEFVGQTASAQRQMVIPRYQDHSVCRSYRCRPDRTADPVAQ
jgi:acetylornithine deacetylase/succinyl-diaminopimelate desuccinylase-like protein